MDRRVKNLRKMEENVAYYVLKAPVLLPISFNFKYYKIKFCKTIVVIDITFQYELLPCIQYSVETTGKKKYICLLFFPIFYPYPTLFFKSLINRKTVKSHKVQFLLILWSYFIEKRKGNIILPLKQTHKKHIYELKRKSFLTRDVSRILRGSAPGKSDRRADKTFVVLKSTVVDHRPISTYADLSLLLSSLFSPLSLLSSGTNHVDHRSLRLGALGTSIPLLNLPVRTGSIFCFSSHLTHDLIN